MVNLARIDSREDCYDIALLVIYKTRLWLVLGVFTV